MKAITVPSHIFLAKEGLHVDAAADMARAPTFDWLGDAAFKIAHDFSDFRLVSEFRHTGSDSAKSYALKRSDHDSALPTTLNLTIESINHADK